MHFGQQRARHVERAAAARRSSRRVACRRAACARRCSASVACTAPARVAVDAPPVSCHISQLSTVPKASSPRSAAARAPAHVVEQPARAWCPRSRRRGRGRCARGTSGSRPRCAQRLAGRRGAPVLPDDGVADRLAGGAVPDDRRLALVGDADARRCRSAASRALASASRAVASCELQISRRVVLDPARLRKDLAELALRRWRRCAPRASKTIARELEVPWSRASRWVGVRHRRRILNGVQDLVAGRILRFARGRRSADARIVAMPTPRRRRRPRDRCRRPMSTSLVVGGGVNGAGIARDLAGRGARVAAVREGRPRRAHLVVVDQADPRRPALPRVPRVLAGAQGARRARGAAQERAAHHVAAALRDAARPVDAAGVDDPARPLPLRPPRAARGAAGLAHRRPAPPRRRRAAEARASPRASSTPTAGSTTRAWSRSAPSTPPSAARRC